MKLRKFLALALCVIMIAGALPLTSSAAKVGDTIDWVLYTDITTYINGYYIPSYNINGYTAVVVEDLLYYGFDVAWDGTAKTLKVTRNYARDINPPDDYKPTKNTHKVGDRAMPVLYTDIKTYFSGDQMTSYNVDGRTIAYVDDLATYYQKSYVWDGTARVLKLELTGDTTPATPLTIIHQPQSVTVSSNSGKAQFSIEVSGGTAPYTYRWQVAKNGTTNFNDVPNSNTFSLNYSYSGASGTSLRCIVTDADGVIKTSAAAQILYTGSQTKPLTASITGGNTSVPVNTSVPLTCTATGGSGAYNYAWYRNGVYIASAGSSTYYAKETTAGTYTYHCVVTNGASVAQTNDVTVTFTAAAASGLSKQKDVAASVGKPVSEGFSYYSIGLYTYYTNGRITASNLAEFGLMLDLSNDSAVLSGTPVKQGMAYAVYSMIRPDGTADTLTVVINVGTSAAKTKTLNITAKVGEYISRTVYYNTEMGETYTKAICTSNDLFNYDLNFTPGTTDHSTFSGTPSKPGTASAVFQLTRADGTVDTLNITINIGAAVNTLKIVTQPKGNTLPADSYEDIPITVSVGISGGVAPYTYQWNVTNNESWGSSDEKHTGSSTTDILSTYIDSQTTHYESSLYYYCVITDSTGQTVTSDYAEFKFLKASESIQNWTATVNATVGIAMNTQVNFADYISNIGAGYSVTASNTNYNADFKAYGLNDSYTGEHMRITGTPTKAGTAKYRLKFITSDGKETVLGYLTITINIKAQAATIYTVTIDATFGTPISKEIYRSDYNAKNMSYTFAESTLKDFGLSGAIDLNSISIFGTPTKVGKATCRADFGNGKIYIDIIVNIRPVA